MWKGITGRLYSTDRYGKSFNYDFSFYEVDIEKFGIGLKPKILTISDKRTCTHSEL